MKKAAITIQRQRLSKAFTIVELLIVIVVIAILVGITVVGYGAVTRNAQDSALKADLQKLGDVIKLKTLDDNGVPDGGATHLNGGNSVVLPGVSFAPTVSAYDKMVSNLYYCSGTISGSKEYALVAKSVSGKTFIYRSNKGIEDFTAYTLTSSNNGVGVCSASGFTAPYTWSYGYNPGADYQWFAWAFNGDTVTNLATNPSAETALGWYSNDGTKYPAIRDTSLKRTGAQSVSASNVAASDIMMSLYSMGAPDGLGNTISESGKYSASIYFRSGVAHKAALGYSYRTASTGVWSGTTYVPYVTGSTTDWTRVTQTIDFPAGVDRVRFVVTVVALAVQPAGTKAYVDDFMLTKTDDSPRYADGSSSGWAWSGTANASTSTGPLR